jgi:DNA repair photolyase
MLDILPLSQAEIATMIVSVSESIAQYSGGGQFKYLIEHYIGCEYTCERRSEARL